MSNLDDRAARAKQELEMVFGPADVPPAAAIPMRHRRRRAALATVAGAVAIVGGIGVGAALQNENDGAGITTTDSSTTTTTTTIAAPESTTSTVASPSTTTAAATPVKPEATEPCLVAATDDGRIVALAPDGSIARDIVVLEGREIGHLQVHDDDVYFTDFPKDDASGTHGCAPIKRVDFAGGEPEIFAEATAFFSIDPGGQRLALGLYASYAECGGNGGLGGTVRVFDLGTGESREWRPPADSDDFFETNSQPNAMNWSPDGSMLAVQWCYEGCDVSRLDPDRDGTVYRDVEPIAGEDPAFAGDALWTLATYYPEEEPGREMFRYDLPGGTGEPSSSPFAMGVHSMHGSGRSLFAFGGLYQGEVFIERWEIDGEVTRLSATDQSIVLIAVG